MSQAVLIESLLQAADQTLRQLAIFLGGKPTEHASLGELVQEIGRSRATGSASAAATRAGVDEELLSRTVDAAHDVARRVAPGRPADTGIQADTELALLRLLVCLERLSQKVEAVAPRVEVSSGLDEDAVARRVRAVELVVRSLITESYRTQDALVSRLRELHKPELVERWLRAAERGNALSGLSFSELATLLVGKQEFGRYEKMFETQRYLRLFQDRRKTLREYLDGLRLVRNDLAHHRPITALQRRLVERYFEEVTGPVGDAYRRSETTVDPQALIDVSKEDLQRFLSGLQQDLDAVALDIEELKAAVAQTSARVSALEGSVVLLVAAAAWFVAPIIAWALSSASGGGTNDIRATLETGDRSLRAMGLSVLTLLLAATRVVLNLANRWGHARALTAALHGKRWTNVTLAWLACSVLVYVPNGSFFMRRVYRSMGLDANAMLAGAAKTASFDAASQLDADGLEDYLSSGGDPNAVDGGGTSLVRRVVFGMKFDSDYKPIPERDAEALRAKLLTLLLDRGARATPEDVQTARSLQRNSTANLLEASMSQSIPPAK